MDAIALELVARLRRNPDDAEAFAALRLHYQRIGDYASLANLLEGWGSRTRDAGAGAHALFEAGELVLGALSDRERAVRMYERALSIEPRHADAFLRLRGLFEDAGEMRRLAELLERQAAALEAAGADPREVALLYHQLGELWEHRFTRVDKAVHHYRRAFELDPTLVAAIYAAREIYRQAGNTKAASSLLEKEAKAEPDPARRVALWRELAHVRVEEQGDHEGAALALKRALEVAPGDLEVMNDLARVYLARAERVKDPHVAASDRHRAADLFYQVAQKVAPDHALAYLESTLDARPDHDGALALYERHAAELGQSALLPARWVAYLAHAPDRPEAAERRLRLADAYLEAGQTEYAITCLEWLLEDGDAEAAERLVDLYRGVGRDDDAVRALGVAALGLAPSERLPRLRELLSALRDRGDVAGAVRWAQEILSVDASDPEALTLIEDACRQSGDYTPLRDALLAASRVNGLSVEARKLRLKDVASISELRLGDLDGAISAWRGVAALDPSDREARAAQKRLLSARERWDELVDVLEREALALTDPEPKAEIYRQIAELHRDRRGDLEGAIRALRHLREIAPSDAAGRDALCDALLEAGATLEVVPLLRERVEESRGAARAELLRLLATVLEERVGDEEGAFEAWTRLLDESPNDLDAIAHMEAIDEAAGRYERLISTLSYRAEVIAPEERPAVLVRMGQLAESALGDLDRAADLYARALELTPGHPAILDALCAVYDRAERYRDLVVLLRETAQAETDAVRRAELYRRIARTLADRVGNEEGAAEAWRQVLAAGEDEEALRFLRHHAARNADPVTLEDVLRRLSDLLAGSSEVRDLALERAELLAERLDRTGDAIVVLRRVVDELAPEHVVALSRLAALCERARDLPGLADALWRQLRLLEDAGLRLPVAQRLSDLHEREAPEPARAIDALFAWASADPDDGAPLERLVPLLEAAARFGDLTGVLDTLASMAVDATEASTLWRRSAEIAYRQLGDVNGAWERLEPRVRAGDGGAEEDLRELARGARRGEKLAELYVSLAQAPTADPRRRWLDAARVYEEYLGDAQRALEAVLRAFAIDLGDRACLDDADRLAGRAGAWQRLGQVYETLIKRSESADEKVALLLRHAKLLDESAGDPSAALDQTLRACALAPLDDGVLALAEERAPRAGRAEELLVTYDKRKQRAADDAGRVEALLRSLRLAELTLRDRARATTYLAQAVALAVRTPALDEVLIAAARELDARPGALGGMRRAIVEIEAALAEDMEENPVLGAQLLLRAARLLSDELRSDDDAFAVLKRAATFAPGEAAALDELEAFGKRVRRLPEVDRHLAQLIEEALDNKTASGLLRRRGALLEELGRFDEAAEVWTRLTTVAAGDGEARERLRAALRRAGKQQDLLVALQRDLRRADDPSERLALMKEIALLWERDLKNRFEALDAWKKVQREAPGDADAKDALARLGQDKRRAPDSEVALLEAPAEMGDEYADMTDPSEEQAAPDSSETMLDPGLYAELLNAQAELAKAQTRERGGLPPLRDVPTKKLDAASMRPIEPPTRELAARVAEKAFTTSPIADDYDDETSLAGRAAVELAAAIVATGLDIDDLGEVEAGNGDPTPASAQLPPARPDDFDDDYTSVAEAEDVFRQIRELRAGSPSPAEDTAGDDAGTGEIALDEAELIAESDVQPLDDLEEIEDEEEIEELDDMEEIAPPVRSVPPPPRRS